MNSKTNQTDKATARPWTLHKRGNVHIQLNVLGMNGEWIIDAKTVNKNCQPTDTEFANAELIVQAVNEHAALKSFVESIAKMDIDFADKAVLESLVSTAKNLSK